LSLDKSETKEFPSLERWGEYKGYTMWLHPRFGFMVMKENSQRMNKGRLDTVKATQAFINKLPPHPTYQETLKKITGQL